jgi:hypothetical protein
MKDRNHAIINKTEHFVMQSFISQKVVCIVEVKIMTKEPNLKEIERKAYMSYHQDGLLDIFAGIYIIGFGLGIFVDIVWDFGMGVIIFPGAFIAIAASLWIAAKRKITMPRIGYVNFGVRGGTSKLVALFIGLAVAGLGLAFVFAFATTQSGPRQWLDLIFQNGMLIAGFGSLIICALFGYSMGLKRLYAYGLLAMITLVIGHFMGIFFAYLLMALGVIVTAAGFALLLSFIKKYPLKGDRAIAE